jgi:hypothetical protein
LAFWFFLVVFVEIDALVHHQPVACVEGCFLVVVDIAQAVLRRERHAGFLIIIVKPATN